MSESLCAPPTEWISTNGLARPSHTARCAGTPWSRARRGSAQAISSSPTTESRRNMKMAGTTWSWEIQTTLPAIQSQIGPYGDGVSRQTPSTLSVHLSGSAVGP